MVEIWPFAERSHGIAFFQLFGRLANFFTTFVNPIGLENAGWKYLISYCCFLAYEVVFVYFMFPETFGRTLEELAFCESRHSPMHWNQTCCRIIILLTASRYSVRGQGARRPGCQRRREGGRPPRGGSLWVEKVYRYGRQETRPLNCASILCLVEPVSSSKKPFHDHRVIAITNRHRMVETLQPFTIEMRSWYCA